MLYTFPLMLYLSNLYNKNVLLILSKNYEKSTKAVYIVLFSILTYFL